MNCFLFYLFLVLSYTCMMLHSDSLEIIGVKPHFVFILDVENVLLYPSKNPSEFTEINCEAMEFLDWALQGMPYYGYLPELFAWTESYQSEWIRSSLGKLTVKCNAQSTYIARLNKHLKIIDANDAERLRLHTNGIKDWGKFRRQLYSYEELDISRNTITFFFTGTSFRTYTYNVCYMQQYSLNSVAILIQPFHPESAAFMNRTRYYSYFSSVGESWNELPYNLYQIVTEKEKKLRTAGQRFHDVRRILESLMKKPSESFVSLNLLQGANTYFNVPSLLECPYDLTAPERLYVVFIIDLKSIQQPELPSLKLLEDFIQLLLKIKHIFLGGGLGSILLHCHPTPDKSLCEKMQQRTTDLILREHHIYFKTATRNTLYSEFPFIDVIYPQIFHQHESEGIPTSVIEALEYGIASRLPRQTTILVKIADVLPQDLNDRLYALKAGGYQMCYSDLLGKSEFEAKKVRRAHREGSSMKCPAHSSLHKNIFTSQCRKSNHLLNYTQTFPTQKQLNQKNLSLVQPEFKNMNPYNEPRFSTRKNHRVTKGNGLKSDIDSQFTEKYTDISLQENPLTRLEFLSDLIISLGLLKRIQMQTKLVLKITSRTAYEATLMFQKGIGNRFACYSFFDY